MAAFLAPHAPSPPCHPHTPFDHVEYGYGPTSPSNNSIGSNKPPTLASRHDNFQNGMIRQAIANRSRELSRFENWDISPELLGHEPSPAMMSDLSEHSLKSNAALSILLNTRGGSPQLGKQWNRESSQNSLDSGISDITSASSPRSLTYITRSTSFHGLSMAQLGQYQPRIDEQEDEDGSPERPPPPQGPINATASPSTRQDSIDNDGKKISSKWTLSPRPMFRSSFLQRRHSVSEIPSGSNTSNTLGSITSFFRRRTQQVVPHNPDAESPPLPIPFTATPTAPITPTTPATVEVSQEGDKRKRGFYFKRHSV